jgi:hypothetical protein
MTMLTAIPRPARARRPVLPPAIARWQLASVLTLGLALLVGHILAAPGAPVLEPDSASYLETASFRPGGYPLLLHVIGAQGALTMQPVLAALALTYLGFEVLCATRSVLAAGVAMLAIALNPFLLAYHYRIMPDSLYVSLLMIFLALIVRFVPKRSIAAIASASAVAGAMIAVRSAGWFALPLLPLAVLMMRSKVHSSRALLAAAVAPLLLIAGLDSGVRTLLSHGDSTSLLSYSLYGKAGLIEAPPSPEPSQPAVALERAFAPVRELIAASPGGAIARYLTINYESCIANACSALLGVDPSSPQAIAAARARVLANPLGFLHVAWRNYRALWSPFGPARPGAAEAANDFLDAHRPLPFEEQALVLTQSIRPAPSSTAIDAAMALIALVTGILALAGLAAATRRFELPATLAMGAIAALAVHGAFSLTALTGVGVPRFTLLMWPAMTLALVTWGTALAAWLGLERLLPQRLPWNILRRAPVKAAPAPVELAEPRVAQEPDTLSEEPLVPLTHPSQLRPPKKPPPTPTAREAVPKEVLAQITAVPMKGPEPKDTEPKDKPRKGAAEAQTSTNGTGAPHAKTNETADPKTASDAQEPPMDGETTTAAETAAVEVENDKLPAE